MKSTYFLDLLFMPEQESMFQGARAYVRANAQTARDHSGEEYKVITHESFSADELDEYIRSLKDELDSISAKAHKAFAKHHPR